MDHISVPQGPRSARYEAPDSIIYRDAKTGNRVPRNINGGATSPNPSDTQSRAAEGGEETESEGTK